MATAPAGGSAGSSDARIIGRRSAVPAFAARDVRSVAYAAFFSPDTNRISAHRRQGRSPPTCSHPGGFDASVDSRSNAVLRPVTQEIWNHGGYYDLKNEAGMTGPRQLIARPVRMLRA